MRTVHDSMGALQVPDNALYGAQTQRAIDNFPISALTMPRYFIRALGLTKQTAAKTNESLKLIDSEIAQPIIAAAQQVIDGEHDAQFAIDVFQTGSGTSSNMNSNEVIAQLASTQSQQDIHPNDHVNYGQSSNDVIPTAIHISACLAIYEQLNPALEHLIQTLRKRAKELAHITKTGRTHLMDAMPVTLGQELDGWAAQIQQGLSGLLALMPQIHALAIGGTAVGTGINAHPDFAAKFIKNLQKTTQIDFEASENRFASMSSQDAACAVSGQLRTLAVSLMKIANDLRWMNSGPLAGFGEIELPALQPGSSIMPGKVNPVIPEAVAMVCAQVIGNDATITVAGQSGNFQLNVMLPVVAYNLLQSIEILANSTLLLADNAIAGFTVNEQAIADKLACNPILVTALNNVIGYELGAKIAKTAYQQNRPVREVAKEMTDLSDKELDKLLDPSLLTLGGIPSLK